MKLEEARKFIEAYGGFRVDFEVQEEGLLRSDHFPADDEPPFESEEEAWTWAARFAKAGKKKGIVNVYVIKDLDKCPVEGYKEKELNIHIPGQSEHEST